MTPPPNTCIRAPEDYFSKVSPLCRRILEDMNRVKGSYGEKWNQLPYDEQCKILDQTIVDEATVRKYEVGGLKVLDCEYFPKLKFLTGQKIVSDEKLSARGYACSWRDEHSAPFSWHTRSQMDLTFIDTPPDTPTDNIAPQKESNLFTPDIEEKLIHNKNSGTLSRIYRPEKTYKSSPFLWHYDPTPDLKPPDPPDLVLNATLSRSSGSNGSSPLLSKGSSFNHLVVRSREERQPGFLGWFRGAISTITGTCLPIHTCGTKTTGENLHPGSPSFIHPELRPPHVIAKGAKVNIPQKKKKPAPKPPMRISSDSLYKLPKDSTLTSECPSAETTSTFDVMSNKGLTTPDGISRSGTNQNLIMMSRLPSSTNRNSQIYEPTYEEEESGCNEEIVLSPKSRETMEKFQLELSSRINKKQHSSFMMDNSAADFANDNVDCRSSFPDTPRSDNQSTDNQIGATEDMPLLSVSSSFVDDSIPKTGFDFLDNW